MIDEPEHDLVDRRVRVATLDELAFVLLTEARMRCELLQAAAVTDGACRVLSAVHFELGMATWWAGDALALRRQQSLSALAHDSVVALLRYQAPDQQLIAVMVCCRDAVCYGLVDADDDDAMHRARRHLTSAIELFTAPHVADTQDDAHVRLRDADEAGAVPGNLTTHRLT